MNVKLSNVISRDHLDGVHNLTPDILMRVVSTMTPPRRTLYTRSLYKFFKYEVLWLLSLEFESKQQLEFFFWSMRHPCRSDCRPDSNQGQVPSCLQRPPEAWTGKGVPLQPLHHHKEESWAGSRIRTLWKTSMDYLLSLLMPPYSCLLCQVTYFGEMENWGR